MELELKIIFLKFILSIATMYIMSAIGGDGIGDFLIPPEEKEQRDDALLVLEKLKEKFPILKNASLTSHELLVAAALVEPKQSTNFANIGGHNEIKSELMLHVVVPMHNSEVFYKNESLRPPSGILLSGPPGTGKTLLATSLASECNVPFLSIKPCMVEQKYFGESEKIVKAIFSFAEKIQPCIIFIDEIDSMLRNRSDFEHASTYSIKTQFLQEMDRIENEGMKVVVVAATNNPHSLDKALYRRLPRSYTVDKPGVQARVDILKRLTANEQPPVKQAEIDWIAEQTDGLSGSDLKDVYKASSAVRNEIFSKQLLELGVVSTSPGPIRRPHWDSAISKTRHTQRFS
jgi:SpoVK/Ycf46/Vps4 family AAA+-type ATPase